MLLTTEEIFLTSGITLYNYKKIKEQVICQEPLYILCEFAEHSFETIGSKQHRLRSKMYKGSWF